MRPRICTTLFLLLFLASTGKAQLGLQFSEDLLMDAIFPEPMITLSYKAVQPPHLSSIKLPAAVPQALFCRLEWHLEKQIELPVRFRLGSVDYVDWLEGKRSQYK